MTTEAAVSSPSFFIARQPILTPKQEVFAYELLFRSGLQSAFDPRFSGEQATSKVISNGFYMLGIDKLTLGKKAFINFSEEMLLQEYPLFCDKDMTVVEILETVQASDEIVATCRNLANKGYTLALDDFLYTPAFDPLLSLAKIVKFDILQMEREELIRQLEQVKPFNVKLLAEKVETQEEFLFLKDLGFHYFQGFFFSKPNIISGRDIPSSRLQVLRLLKLLNDPNYDFENIGSIVSQDLSLSYRLLKFVNSAWFALPQKIESLQNAIVMLGEKNLRKWLSLIALSSMADDKPTELIRMAISRAHFCEKLGSQLPGLRDNANSLYTIGMFSLLEAILDKPMAEILAELSLSDTINDILLGKKKNLLAAPLYLLRAYEYGNWPEVANIARQIHFDQKELPAIFQGALNAVAQLEAAL